MRRILSWKFAFYAILLPSLRRLGPRRADAVLNWLGRAAARAIPGRRRQLADAIRNVGNRIEIGRPIETLVSRLAADSARFQARDYLLDGLDDAAALSRFDVRGATRLEETLKSGRGAVLVGSHLGAHLAGIHWFHRRGIAVRLLAQRPGHVSAALRARFDEPGPHPQAELFLRRDLSPEAATRRVFLARAAIRDGLAIYLNGDIPWRGPNTREGQILGRPHRLLSTWIDLAVLTGAPVFWVFCTHEPGGRYALDLEPAGTIRPGGEVDAHASYLAELNARIANEPTEAVAHLLWPCYAQSSRIRDDRSAVSRERPSRRRPVWRES